MKRVFSCWYLCATTKGRQNTLKLFYWKWRLHACATFKNSLMSYRLVYSSDPIFLRISQVSFCKHSKGNILSKMLFDIESAKSSYKAVCLIWTFEHNLIFLSGTLLTSFMQTYFTCKFDCMLWSFLPMF